MEQMEILLTVPTVSKSTVSSTPKSTGTGDDRSFADLYEQNINNSKSGNVESTNKNTKQNESVDNSDKAETKVENKSSDKTTAESEVTEESAEQNVVSINWVNVLELAADTSDAETDGMSTDLANETQMVGTSQIASVEVDTDIAAETTIKNGEQAEKALPKNTDSEKAENTAIAVDEMLETKAQDDETTLSRSTIVSTPISETTFVDGITEETSESEVAVNMVQNEVVAQTSTTATKQTTETPVVNNDFSAMMSDDLPQSNIQESVMSQIGNSLGKIVKTGNSEIRIQLEPEHLGVLNIRVIAGKDGTQVVFKADSHQSSQLIAGQTESLKAMLNEAGIKVDQIVVNDFSFSQENYQDQQTFEQQNGKNNKFYKNLSGNTEKIETYDDGYELPQTIVGLNYLI